MERIVDFQVDDEMSSFLNNRVSSGDTYPLLVVSSDDENNTVSGVVFMPDGHTHYVTNYEVSSKADNAETSDDVAQDSTSRTDEPAAPAVNPNPAPTFSGQASDDERATT